MAGNTTAPTQLVVFNSDTNTKLATIGSLDGRAIAENRNAAFRNYKRVGTGQLTIEDVGSTANKLNDGQLSASGTLTRTITSSGPLVILKSTASGSITFTADGVTETAFILAGKLSCRSLSIGTFSE